MSGTDREERAETPAADRSGKLSAREYFDRLERRIIDLRGAPLLLAPKEWQVAKAWREEGIPVELVERVLGELATKLDEKADDRPMTLSYAKRAVKAAWKRHGELQAPAADSPLPELDVARRLEELAASLPEAVPEAWKSRIRTLEGSPERVESALAEIDRELREELEGRWSDDEVRALEAEVADGLAALETRLPSGEVERARERLRSRLFRRRAELPVLSLFG